MTRTIMISDIHGCIGPLERLLEKIAYDPETDRLVLLGDYVDRGPNSKEVVERVIELVRGGAVALRGNHDQRLVDLIRTDDAGVRQKFVNHGGQQTVCSYCGASPDEPDAEMLERARAYIGSNYTAHIDFLESLPLYYKDDIHICVHAGLNPLYDDWKSQPPYDFMYIKDDFIRARTKTGKRVVFGHTRTSDIHGDPGVWFQEDKIGIDGGCAYGMQLNALIYENGSYRTASEKSGREERP